MMDTLWRKKNGCDGTEKATVSYRSATTVCQYWDCPLAPVESCALNQIDHCWYGGRSGGFPTCYVRDGDVDATKHMFDFWDRNRARKNDAAMKSESNPKRVEEELTVGTAGMATVRP